MLLKVFFASIRPSQRHLHRSARAAGVGRIFRTLVESHDDVRAQANLDLHRIFRRQKMCGTVQMRPKRGPFLGNFSQLAQAKNLETA